MSTLRNGFCKKLKSTKMVLSIKMERASLIRKSERFENSSRRTSGDSTHLKRFLKDKYINAK